ncbi:MAG: acyl carrier protein [bacterium]
MEKITQKKTLTKVKGILAKKFGVERKKIIAEAHLHYDLNLIDRECVALIIEVESCFGIRIPDEEAEKIQQVQDLLNYLKFAGISE